MRNEHRLQVADGLVTSSTRLFLPSVVATACTHCQTAVAAGAGFDVNAAVSAGALRGRGFIPDGVLVANIMSHAAADLVDFIQCARQEGHSTRARCNFLKRPTSASLFLFPQQANGVNGRAIFRL